MSVQEIESAIHRLSRTEAEQLRVWLDDYLEDQLELTDGVKDTLDQSRRKIAEGKFTFRQPSYFAAALPIWSATYSKAFDMLPEPIRRAVQEKVDEMGSRLSVFPHKRLSGRPECRLRVGDYRVLYEFNAERGRVHLHYVGNRREIYRRS